MRIIKFRIWDKIYDDWIIQEAGGVSGDGKILCYRSGGIIGGWITEYDQERFVIQKFTGLTDKNGTEVYEGDIVSVRMFGDWNDEVGCDVAYVVRWCPIQTGFRGFTKKMVVNDHSGIGLPQPITILGNILENPDLLK